LARLAGAVAAHVPGVAVCAGRVAVLRARLGLARVAHPVAAQAVLGAVLDRLRRLLAHPVAALLHAIDAGRGVAVALLPRLDLAVAAGLRRLDRDAEGPDAGLV